jgi:hypothetical protein
VESFCRNMAIVGNFLFKIWRTRDHFFHPKKSFVFVEIIFSGPKKKGENSPHSPKKKPLFCTVVVIHWGVVSCRFHRWIMNPTAPVPPHVTKASAERDAHTRPRARTQTTHTPPRSAPHLRISEPVSRWFLPSLTPLFDRLCIPDKVCYLGTLFSLLGVLIWETFLYFRQIPFFCRFGFRTSFGCCYGARLSFVGRDLEWSGLEWWSSCLIEGCFVCLFVFFPGLPERACVVVRL